MCHATRDKDDNRISYCHMHYRQITPKHSTLQAQGMMGNWFGPSVDGRTAGKRQALVDQLVNQSMIITMLYINTYIYIYII